mmetsp:Transcript_96769/g.216823  ORF Transcript_96769/g.216823 Transcript_96769/m.216823 type:complete len:203 (-) Transcript_96769:34-642(-)
MAASWWTRPLLLLLPVAVCRASVVVRRQQFNEASSSAVSAASSPDSDQVVGRLKGLLDAYVQKYVDEEARFAEASAGMDGVINATVDTEARLRAIDEKARMKEESEKRLASTAGFIRTLDNAVKAMPGNASWLDKFADLKAKVDRVYQANPVLLAKTASVHNGHAASRGLRMAENVVNQAKQIAEEAEAYLAYLGGGGKIRS